MRRLWGPLVAFSARACKFPLLSSTLDPIVMKLGFSGAGGISPNPPREALKIHPEEDLGALSPFSVLRAPHEARKASKNAFFVFRKNRRLRRPNHIHPPQATPNTHKNTHHANHPPHTSQAIQTTDPAILHDNSKMPS